MGFNCISCGGKLNKFDVPLNKKLISRESEDYLCEDCLCKKLNITREDLYNYAVEQKKRECVLFDYPIEELEDIR